MFLHPDLPSADLLQAFINFIHEHLLAIGFHNQCAEAIDQQFQIQESIIQNVPQDRI